MVNLDLVSNIWGPGHSTNNISNTNSGNVGIGVSSPGSNLTIQNNYGSTNAALFLVASSTAANGSTANTLFTVNSVGQVGVGTSVFPSPVGGANPVKFNVNGGSVFGTGQVSRSQVVTFSLSNSTAYSANNDIGDGNRSMNIVNENSTANTYAPLSFRTQANGNTGMLDMKLVGPNDGTSKMIFTFKDTTGGAGFYDRFVMQSNGNMGIGTTSPSQALDVKGNIKLSGSVVSDGDICIGTCQ